MKNWESTSSRVLFALAAVLAGIALLEKVINLLGFTLSLVSDYAPSRLLELSAVVLLFVITLQLRGIKRVSMGA